MSQAAHTHTPTPGTLAVVTNKYLALDHQFQAITSQPETTPADDARLRHLEQECANSLQRIIDWPLTDRQDRKAYIQFIALLCLDGEPMFPECAPLFRKLAEITEAPEQ